MVLLAAVVCSWFANRVHCMKFLFVLVRRVEGWERTMANWRSGLQCRTPYAIVDVLFLLMMGIMVPETC